VQGDRQAAGVWLGDEVDEGRCGGGVKPADVELYTGAMGGILVEGRPLAIPRGRLIAERRGITSIVGRTRFDSNRGSPDLSHPRAVIHPCGVKDPVRIRNQPRRVSRPRRCQFHTYLKEALPVGHTHAGQPSLPAV
jgi:hypothetical protein